MRRSGIAMPVKILVPVLCVLVFSFLLPRGLAWAAGDKGASGTPAKVLAVETFLADIAQNVAGDRLKIESLLPDGVDPHSFEPTPRDVTKVADSRVLIINGGGVEEFLGRLLENAGGERTIINASTGLTSRRVKEGEAAEMGESDLADAACTAARKAKSQSLRAGRDVASAKAISEETGLYEVTLTKQPDGSFGGYLEYSTDESGDFLVASGDGRLGVADRKGSSGLDMEKTFSPGCGNLTRGGVVELEKGEYIFAMTGFKAEKSALLVGPLGGHHHHEGDPHFWLAPRNVLTYVTNIRLGLTEADPDGAAVYAANAAAYSARIEELDRWIAGQVEQIPPDRRLLVTNHESFGYFADRYGFKVIGTIVPGTSTEAAPSARELAKLVDGIKATGTKAIFLETGTNPRLAQQVARETGIKVVTELYTHSTTGPKGPAPTYIDMMKYNTSAIVEALK